MITKHASCLLRPMLAYALAATAGVALAGDAGVQSPAGLPDVSGFAWPGAAVLAAWLVRTGGPVITIRHVQAKDE